MCFRAIDFQQLIGSIGGYVGMCLGYSLLQVPLFVHTAVYQIVGILSKIRKKFDQHGPLIPVRSSSNVQAMNIKEIP